MDLAKIHQNIVPVIHKAEKIALTNFGKKQNIKVKEGVASQAALVTEVDQKLDALFREELRALYPDFGFITEEEENTILKKYNWIIDPIDGTTNYSRNYPMFGISIALWEENIPVYGSLTLPKFGKIMHGFKNGGVFVNNEKLIVDYQIQSPKPFVFLAPVAQPDDHASVTRIIGQSIVAPRDFGCSVYQSYETILGNADLQISYKLSLWDVAAAVLLAKEAGLEVEFISPLPDINNSIDYSHTVVLGRKNLVDKIAQNLKSIISP